MLLVVERCMQLYAPSACLNGCAVVALGVCRCGRTVFAREGTWLHVVAALWVRVLARGCVAAWLPCDSTLWLRVTVHGCVSTRGAG